VNKTPLYSFFLKTFQSACGPEYILATPTQGLLFPAADFVRTQIQTALNDFDDNEGLDRLPVVIDFRNIQKLDFTAAMVNKMGPKRSNIF
jgi:hypothetical protein